LERIYIGTTKWKGCMATVIGSYTKSIYRREKAKEKIKGYLSHQISRGSCVLYIFMNNQKQIYIIIQYQVKGERQF
jgi:hypothetical protein